MGVITTTSNTSLGTIMNHKCCDCSYDSLFVKEVIRTYCGTTESIDVGEPPEPDEPTPPITTDPEIPQEPEEPELPPEEQPGWDVSILNPEFTGW